MVFENIVSKIIQSTLGEYSQCINGLENLNMSYWSGKVLLKNLTVKNELATKLKLPFDILFSNIGKLEATIPWNQLSSQPITVHLSDIYLVISPKTTENPEDFDIDPFQIKQDTIEKYFKRILSNIDELKKINSESDKSWTGTLISKIMNNLTFSIKNIHIRMEVKHDLFKTPFSYGFTLAELSIFTTNSYGLQIFNKEPSESEPMYKKIELKNAAVYWNHHDHSFGPFASKESTINRMKNTVFCENNLKNEYLTGFSYLVHFDMDIMVTHRIRTKEIVLAN